MANSNISSIGRFSSQMLTYLGTQRTVKNVSGEYANTFKYALGPTTFPSPGSVQQADLGGGVVGNWSPQSYNSTVSYFLSRGASNVYADNMTGLAIDIASVLNISAQALLERSSLVGTFALAGDSYRVFNALRDPSHQIGEATSVVNKYSLQAREIRA